MMPIILMSAIMLIATVVCYINVIKKRNEYIDRIDLRIDLFFILYILLCILQSSLTIRVELRFLLSSFMGLFIYLCHMVNVSSKDTILPYYNVKKTSPRIKFIMLITFSIFFICKVISCIYFKSVSENIFIINEQKVINGFYDATMGSYDVETLKSKNILITSNNYKTFIDEEYTHFFDQFDRKISDRVIIEISSDPERLLEALTNDDIILYEAPNYKFEEFKK